MTELQTKPAQTEGQYLIEQLRMKELPTYESYNGPTIYEDYVLEIMSEAADYIERLERLILENDLIRRDDALKILKQYLGSQSRSTNEAARALKTAVEMFCPRVGLPDSSLDTPN